MSIRVDHDGRLIKFDYAKITCGREINGDTVYSRYCQGRNLDEVLNLKYTDVVRDLNITDEERQFILYLEWDALRSAIAQYIGMEAEDLDQDRCRISSIECDEQGVEINQVILPPKSLPKILPCNLASANN